MTVLSFAEEFTRLVIRYTKTSSTNNSTENVPLTNKEIASAVKNVLFTILGVNEFNSDNYSERSLTNGMDIITPTAPVVPKFKQEQNDEDVNRFQNAQSAVMDFDSSSVDSLSLGTNEEEAKNFLEVSQDKKKFIQSTPVIYINNIDKSDTYTCEKNREKEIDQDVFNDVYVNVGISSALLQSFLAVRESTINLMTKVDDFEKQVFPQPVRQLSSNGNFSDLNSQISTTIKMTPCKMDGSITAIPKVPSESTKKDIFDKKYRRTSYYDTTTTSRKLNKSATIKRSSSISNLSTNKSCNKSSGSITRPAKNPKYSHVQSHYTKAAMLKPNKKENL